MIAASLALSLLAAVPVFKGFEEKRYQQHDAIIAKCVREFNRHRGAWADANRNQARTIPNITEELVKAHMIQETGGGDGRSKAAWDGDPLLVNGRATGETRRSCSDSRSHGSATRARQS